MRIIRIYCPQSLNTGAFIELDAKAARHVHQVLRLRPGDSLQLFDGQGAEYHAQIDSSDRRQVTVRLDKPVDVASPESPLRIHLGIAISKGDRMDWVIQKATELGVDAITPLFSRRVDVKLNAERQAKKHQHWQQVLISACEQCGRSTLPTLHTAASLPDWLAEVQGDQKWVLAPGEAGLEGIPAPSSAALLIGPEGGLEEGEIQQASDRGFTPLSLGPRVLRTETAPLAALAILQHLWGDM